MMLLLALDAAGTSWPTTTAGSPVWTIAPEIDGVPAMRTSCPAARPAQASGTIGYKCCGVASGLNNRRMTRSSPSATGTDPGEGVDDPADVLLGEPAPERQADDCGGSGVGDRGRAGPREPARPVAAGEVGA